MQAGTRRRIGLFLAWLGVGAVVGAVIGGAAGSAVRDAPLHGVVLGALAGVINGVAINAVIAGAEIFLPQTRLGQNLDRAPFLLTFAAKWLVYGTAILLVIGGRLGSRLVVAALFSREVTPVLERVRGVPPALPIAFAFVGTLVFILVLQLSRLIGERTLRDIVLGRYHRARTEERFFLFVDIVGSTPLAERIGPDAVYRFLGEVFRVASPPIDDHGGEVYQYVGDEIVITWTVAEGRDQARPLACFFAIQQALEAATLEFQRDFGTVPRLRAALHAGSVMAGEVGGTRRAIVYHGDVMNTTSRIEQATRDLERSFLASTDALQRLDGVDGYTLEDLGPQHLRGRAAPVRVHAVLAKP